MKVVFHVGQAKTGTTAIQKSMSANRQALLDQGILYPKNNSGKILRQIEKFSAMGDVIVRQFSREMLVDNDIVKDACDAVGIDPHQFRTLAKEPNSSISAEGGMLLQEYRRRHHLQKDNIFTKDTNAFIQKIRQVENNHPDVFTKIKVRRGLAQVLDQERPDTEKNFRTLWCRLKPKLRGVISRRAGFDGCCRCG